MTGATGPTGLAGGATGATGPTGVTGSSGAVGTVTGFRLLFAADWYYHNNTTNPELYPGGAVTGATIGSMLRYRYLQKQVDGSWITVSTIGP